jgi:hypothetical protein
LGLLSPSIRSLSAVSKVIKFDWIWVWNAETQHLCTRFESNYNGCTQQKGKTSQNRMKLSLPPKKLVLFWVSTPLRRPLPVLVYFRVLVLCFPDFTRNCNR